MSREYTEKELELRSQCELGFNIGARGDRTISVTGEPYIELVNPNMLHVTSEQVAFDLAVETFSKYAEGRSGTIYWRIWPEIEQQSPKGWKFYMRVLVSDKPALVASESDDRTANNTVRHTYRVLTDDEKQRMVELKDAGAAFIDYCNAIGKSRELSLAITKMEEAVMWAVKSLTK